MKKEQTYTILRLVLAVLVLLFAKMIHFSFEVTFFICVISYLLSGITVLKKSVKNILEGNFFDENCLMLIATVGAFAIGQYSEGIAVMVLYEIGEMFQDGAVSKSKKAITDLMDIRPDFANLVNGENIERVVPESVNVGDLILVGAGEKIPLDGTVEKGMSNIDLSALTGESVPKFVDVGDKIYSGGINIDGVLYIRVDKTYKQSTVSKILELVENSETKKAKIESFMTKFSRYYTPIIVSLAILLVIIGPVIFPQIPFRNWVERACMFLVVSCPCALVISLPLSIFCGIGRSSKNGILIKGGIYLEMLANIKSIVFDKTGTLTRGVFEVVEINNGYNKELLKFAAYCEAFSTHPIALAIRNEYGEKIEFERISESKEIAGLGVECVVEGRKVLAGNKRLLDKYEIKYEKVNKIGNVVYVAVDDVYAGYIVVADNIKDTTKEAIKKLKKDNICVAILTGDSEIITKEVAKELDIQEMFYEVLPQDKVKILQDYMNKKDHLVAYAGDGINDAPALVTSDVGISMGAMGSDAAIEASDVVIMDDNVEKICKVIEIAKETIRMVKQNITFILAIKFTVLVLCACGIATMWEAVLADVGVSLLAILNSIHGLKSDIRLSK